MNFTAASVDWFEPDGVLQPELVPRCKDDAAVSSLGARTALLRPLRWCKMGGGGISPRASGSVFGRREAAGGSSRCPYLVTPCVMASCTVRRLMKPFSQKDKELRQSAVDIYVEIYWCLCASNLHKTHIEKVRLTFPCENESG